MSGESRVELAGGVDIWSPEQADETAEALQRMAEALKSTPAEVAERILTAATTLGTEAALKAINTTGWRRPKGTR